MGAEPIPHELLLRHAGFLRRLARDLVGDPAAADDAVQEVWVRALEKPPRESANLRAWLRVVLTNLVRTKARADSRREVRERERTAEPGTNDESTLRSVTEAVLALDEPLRSTVLQHYFQGLTTAEIAARDHLPVSTVKSRLQRALEILRLRMQNAHGSAWQASLLALAVSSKIGKGALLVSLKTKLAIGAVALVAMVVAYRRITADSESPPASPQDVAALAPAAEPSNADAKSVAASEPAPPRSQISTTVPAPAVDPRPDSLLYGSLLDPEGKPILGARWESVGITDENGRSRSTDAKADGAFAFHAMPAGRYWMRATVDGFIPSERSIELQPDRLHVRQDITLQPAPRLSILATTPEGEDLTEALGKTGDAYRWSMALAPVATEERPGVWCTENDGNRQNPHDLGRFVNDDPLQRTDPTPAEKGYMGVLTLTREPPVFVSLLYFQRVLQTREVKRGDKEVRFVLAADEIAALTATVRLQVVDAETQKPIKGAGIQVRGGNGVRGALPSNEDGVIVIKGLNPGEYGVRVSAKGYATGIRQFFAESGPNSDLGQIALEPEVAFEARVVDSSGAPLNANFRLGVLDPATQEFVFEPNTAYGTSGGLLKLVGLGRRLYVLQTDNHEYGAEPAAGQTKWISGSIPIDLRPGVAPANFEILLTPARRLLIRVRDADAVGLRFQVLDESGISLAGYRLYQSAPFGVALPDGKYRVQLLDPSRKVLCDKPVTLDGSDATVELAR